MIERIYKCNQCSAPCILRVQHQIYFITELQPKQCPFGAKKVEWELVE